MRTLGRLLWNLPEFICIVVLAGITAIIGGAVTSRYLFFFAFTWAEELVRFLFIWLAFIGGALAVKHARHFRLTLVRDAVPPAFGHILDLFGHVCFIALGAILLIYGAEIVRLTMEQTSPGLELPQGLVYVAMPLGGAMMILYASAHFYAELQASRRRGLEAPPA